MNFYEITTTMSGRFWIQAEDAPHAYQTVHRILSENAEFKLERITDLQFVQAPPVTRRLADARSYIAEHDSRARVLNRATAPALRVTYREALEEAGQVLLVGGPVSRDDYIRSILELEFPDISEARSAYLKLA